MIRRMLVSMYVGTALFCFSASLAWGQHTVDVSLDSPQDGMTVDPDAAVTWSISVQVSAGGSLGLSLIAVDLAPSPDNPETITLVPATAVPSGMEAFAPPSGVTNPGAGPIEAYGGTLVGDSLLQVGGGQDNSGVVQVAGGVALASQTVASGTFTAPSTPGLYRVSVASAVANVFTEINDMPAISMAVSATCNVTGSGDITFTVGGAAPCLCGDINRSGGAVNLDDFATFALCYGAAGPNPPACDAAAFECSDMDGNGAVNLDDFATFANFFGAITTFTVPNCVQ
jgi:hypothetical protein